MFNQAGILSWAEQQPGIPDKVYTTANTGEMLALHSIVGSYQGAIGRLMSRELVYEGGVWRYSSYSAASVHFILKKNGTLVQMYSILKSCWASGSRTANTRSIAIELEGGALGNEREPMTDEQVASFLRLAYDWAAFKRLVPLPNINMFQHKQLVAMFGGGATACASDRYDRALATLHVPKVEEMTPEEVKALVREVLRNEQLEEDDSLRSWMQARVELMAVANGPHAKDAVEILRARGLV